MKATSAGLQHEIDGHQYCAEAGERKSHAAKACELRARIATREPFGNASLRQSSRNAINDLIEFGVGPSHLAASDRQFMRASSRRFGEADLPESGAVRESPPIDSLP
jgi:hypothetical protein